MAKIRASDILGINARQQLFSNLNPPGSGRFASSKLEAKSLLEKHHMPVPRLYAKFSGSDELDKFDFSKIDSSFVIKPTGGNAGKGILIVKRKSKLPGKWIGLQGQTLTERDLRLHVSDILEGQYSTYGTTHVAFVEERIMVHPRLKKFVHQGTPDIRVIVYNKVPVMAMLRLPTKESEGRANLHQGAIGLGVDMASGVTLKGVCHDKVIRFLPGGKRKVNGIRVPKWNSVLRLAVKAANVAGYVYCGVDLFVDENLGPMVAEFNVNPGLAIQLANGAGLRRRLERVDGLQIRDEEHGVRVGKALFAEQFADKVKADEGLVIVDLLEEIKIRNKKYKSWVSVLSRQNTGAKSSVMDVKLAESLGLVTDDQVLWYEKRQEDKNKIKTPVIEVVFKIRDRKIRTSVRLVSLEKAKAKVILGWKDLQGFLVNSNLD